MKTGTAAKMFNLTHTTMRAIDFLDWVIREDVCPEMITRVKVDEDFDCNAFCGIQSKEPIPTGEYAVIYTDVVENVSTAGQLALMMEEWKWSEDEDGKIVGVIFVKLED